MAIILVVDDDEANRYLICAMFPLHEVREARNAAEAYESIEKQSPDLLILDLSLPDASGFDVLKYVRTVLRCTMPALLYTATRPDATVMELAALYGVTGFLAKPCEPQAAIALVEATLVR